MPISKKIEERIRNLKVDDEFKSMMIDILLDEDSGSYKYRLEYEKHVKNYLVAVKKDGGQND